MRSTIFHQLVFLITVTASLQAQQLPYFQKKGSTTQLIVDNHPFLMISGELHNSSSSSESYLTTTWDQIKQMNLNSVIASISWEQFEPQEGVYDYTLIDALIKKATEDHIKLCIIWFATWKNGKSTFTPMWVKKDPKRFFRAGITSKNPDKRMTEVISPFCEEAMKADAKAFAALMKHIKKVDHKKTVILMQPENEVGLFQDIDYHEKSLQQFQQEVPKELIAYLQKNESILQKEIKLAWKKNGAQKSGSWVNVFGDTPLTKSFFTTWQYATYINEVAKAGKKEYNIPMFVNAWVVQKPTDLPGVYPNGGPVAKVMDIYKAAAPDIDLVCPDIYLPNYKETAALYVREDNPLIVPESRLMAGRAFYAFAELNAIGYSPFGVEDGYTDYEYVKACEVLNELTPLITKFQGTGKMRGILKEGNEKHTQINYGDIQLKIKYLKNYKSAYGLIIQTAAEEFIIAGIGFQVTVTSSNKSKSTYIGQRFEGGFTQNEWVTSRLLNGDEGGHSDRIRILGRALKLSEKLKNNDTKTIGPDFYSANKNKIIYSPGVYKMSVYSVGN